MTWFQNIINAAPKFYIPHIGLTDCVEILILIFTLYKIIKGIKNTRAMVILKGIGILSLFYCVSYLLNFNAILTLFQGVITLAIFAIIVVFQPELRKFLESMGTKKVPFKNKLFSLFKRQVSKEERYSENTIEALVNACFELSKTKTGALIVLEKDVPLTEYADSGIYLNSDITKELLINIFEKNTPLHDGAVIVDGDKLISATAYLPLSDNKKINKNMGTRHRAAIGISEVTDCQVLVVSEENGNVSYVKDGTIKYNLSRETLISNLKKEQFIQEKQENENTLLARFRHNLPLKIFSTVIALVAWLFIMNNANPIVSKTIDNIPITVVNEDAIINTGKIYEIVSDKEVSVVISGKRSEIDTLSKEDIVVVGDLSKLSYVYAVPLSAHSTKYKNVTCTVKNNEIMTVRLNDKIEKEFPVEIEKTGKNKEYFVGDFDISQPNIIISGSKEIINIIGSVKLQLDISNITTNSSANLIPVIYDKNGSEIKDKTLTTNPTEIEVHYKVYPQKEVPVIISANNFEQVKEIQQNLDFVTIAGSKNDINKINEINIEIESTDLQLNQSTEFTKTLLLQDYLPDNIYLSDKDKEIIVTLLFDTVYEKEITFQKTDIHFKNLDDKYNIIFEETSKAIKISGEKELVDSILITTLAPYLDLKDLGEGEYNLIPQYNTIEGIKIVESPLIKIKIVER